MALRRKPRNQAMLAPMGDMLKLIWWAVIGLFRSRVSLEVEILTLRHQLNVLRRTSPERLALSNFDRLVFASLYWIAPRVVNALMMVKPETVIRWHRAGFRSFWRWKSRCRGGRPKVPLPGFERDARHDLMCAALLERLGNSKGKISGAVHIAISGTPASVSSR